MSVDRLKFEQFYREIFSDLKIDTDEYKQLTEYATNANPPPDSIVWLRAAAFRIGSEFLSNDNSDKPNNDDISLIRAINVIVHSLEQTCMEPQPKLLTTKNDNNDDDLSAFDDLYRRVYEDLKIDPDENREMMSFFATFDLSSPKAYTHVRAAAFRVGCEFLSGGNKANNVSLLRSINAVVHALERSYMKPKMYTLSITPCPKSTISSIGLSASLSSVMQHYWTLDSNRLAPNIDYTINVQKGKQPYHRHDAAPLPLFSRLDERHLRHRPTYKSFIALLDNYIAEAGHAEIVTEEERREEKAFLEAVMRTAPMQFCHKYCVANDSSIPRSREGFKALLHKLWFKLYRRTKGNKNLDSCGFEHVFVGEVKDGKMMGFHNWIQFYLEEKKGAIDYRGYIKPRGKNDQQHAQTNEDDHVLTIQFTWHGVEKFMGGGFIGVSPEFELAVYTTCFLLGEEENEFELDTGTDVFELVVKCHKMANGQIGTAYPEITSHYDDIYRKRLQRFFRKSCKKLSV